MEAVSKAERLRRHSVVTAALAAVLGIGPALAMPHRHFLLGFVCIGVQILLLIVALRLFTESKRLATPTRK